MPVNATARSVPAAPPHGLQIPERLPALDGPFGSAMRLLYVVLAALTLIVVVGTVWFAAADVLNNAPNSIRFGFRTATEANKPFVAAVSPAAAEAGLAYRDRIAAIDGKRLPPTATEFDIGDRLGAAQRPQIRLAVIGEAGTRQVTLVDNGVDWRSIDPLSGLPLWLYILLELVVQPRLVLVAASLLLFARRRRDPETMLFAFAFLLLCWGEGVLWWMSDIGLPVQILSEFTFLGWIAAFIAIAAFPDGRFQSRWALWTIVAGVTVEFAGLVSFVTGSSSVANLARQISGVGLFLVALLASVAVLLRYRRSDSDVQRQQIKWAVAGFCVSALMVLIFTPLLMADLLPDYASPTAYIATRVGGLLGFGALPLGLLISLLRYRLYDADSAISRSAAYAVLTLGFVAIFAGSQKIIEVVAERYFEGAAGAVSGAVAAAFAGVLIAPMHNRVRDWAEHRFQKSLIRLRRDLPDCVGDLRETADPNDLIEEVLARISEEVRASCAAAVIEGDVTATHGIPRGDVEDWLGGANLAQTVPGVQLNRQDELFPVRVPLRIIHHGSDTPLGWILIGPRPDGSLVGNDEREALCEIADPIARAIKIAMARKAREDRQAARDLAIDAKFTAIERCIREIQSGKAGPTPKPA